MIYIHTPFCGSFCTYCGFYSVIPGRGGFGAYLASLSEEIRRRSAETEASLGVNTLYIGGGTPSLLPAEAFVEIVKELNISRLEEFTVEVNPEDIVQKGRAYVDALRRLGVSRFSMGVQSLDDAVLRFMNRRHSSEGARKAFALLRGERSVDIITGVPGMGFESLRKTLEELLRWRPEHISAYQLSIEEGSALAGMLAEGCIAEAPEEECRRQYDFVCEALAAEGYEHYEISNWALPGHRARHNSAYWTGQPYVGLGPSAHSLRVFSDGRRVRSWNSLSSSGWKIQGSETLTEEQKRLETIMLGLRTAEGVPAEALLQAPAGATEEGASRRDALKRLQTLENGNLRIPEKDFFVADEIISIFA